MPILSYLAYPAAGRQAELKHQLNSLPECTVHAPEAGGGEVLVLVTDTPDEKAEKDLRVRLEGIEDLQCLALVFGHRETDGAAVEGEL